MTCTGPTQVVCGFPTAFTVAASVAWLLVASPGYAAPADSSGVTYGLITPPSSLDVGCYGPCECPIVTTPTYGSFQLVKLGVDPLYTHYAVERYIASFNNGPGAVAIVGAGQYKIGGEVALVQELTLDLTIEGRPPVHFDSGLQPVRVSFPQIEISSAAHGFACFDSVVVVDAVPVDPATASPPPSRPAGLRAVEPNPFKGRTVIAFAVDRLGPVSLTILDAAGRRVRTLASGAFDASGQHSVSWDGLCDDGRVALAGVYWAQLRWSGGMDSRRFVKLD